MGSRFPGVIVGVVRIWLPLAAGITVLAATAYVAVQQDIRISANDPQIQMSEDGAAALAGGKAAQSLVSAEKVDISTSLAPFLMVMDETGKAVASSAQLDAQSPLPPSGIFDYARQHGQNRLTWQPGQGVRIAAVVTYYTGSAGSGFVLAGRSMREIERREDVVGQIVLAGWAGSLAAALVAVGAAMYLPALLGVSSSDLR